MRGSLPLTTPDLTAHGELFRWLVLAALVGAQRLSQGLRSRLLLWRHSGVGEYSAQAVLPGRRGRTAHASRYAWVATTRTRASSETSP